MFRHFIKTNVKYYRIIIPIPGKVFTSKSKPLFQKEKTSGNENDVPVILQQAIISSYQKGKNNRTIPRRNRQITFRGVISGG